MKTIDCRGLACPAPVLQTKDVIESGHPELIQVRVDNEAARENVSRFLASRDFQVTVEEAHGSFIVTGRQQAGPARETPKAHPEPAKKKIMVMVASDTLGRGDDGLGSRLMGNFLTTLKEMGDELWRLVFVNNGVKLTATGSPVLPVLAELGQGGTQILVCGTCLEHFRLLDRKQVGETTNMLDIVTAMQVADKVINI